jgi:hypothetical protein
MEREELDAMRYTSATIGSHTVWSDCGPSFEEWAYALPEQGRIDLANLFREYGELRVRYAGALVEPLSSAPHHRMQLLKMAVRRRWLAPASIKLLADPSTRSAVPWPWLEELARAYDLDRNGLLLLQDLTRKSQWMDVFRVRDFDRDVSEEEQLWLPVFVSRGLLVPTERGRWATLHGDLQAETVVAWLSYLRHGETDPLLAASWKRYQPAAKTQQYQTADHAS